MLSNAMAEVLFQTFSPIIGYIIFIENFINEVMLVENLENLYSMANIYTYKYTNTIN